MLRTAPPLALKRGASVKRIPRSKNKPETQFSPVPALTAQSIGAPTCTLRSIRFDNKNYRDCSFMKVEISPGTLFIMGILVVVGAGTWWQYSQRQAINEAIQTELQSAEALLPAARRKAFWDCLADIAGDGPANNDVTIARMRAQSAAEYCLEDVGA